MKEQLKPIYDKAISFYGKAETERTSDSIVLYSYNTKVVEIKGDKVILNNKIDDKLLFSNTTLRHIKEFLKQNGFKAETKQQIIKDYMEVKNEKNLKNFIDACKNEIVKATPKKILAFYDSNVSIEMLGHKITLPFDAVVFNAVIACCDKIYEKKIGKGNTNKNLSK